MASSKWRAAYRAEASSLGLKHGQAHLDTGMIWASNQWSSPEAFGQSQIASILQSIKTRSREKNRPFDLTREWFNSAYPKDGRCPVLGLTLAWGTEDRGTSPSVDRINPDLNYTTDNCRVISMRANMLKSNGTLEEMRLIVRDLEASTGVGSMRSVVDVLIKDAYRVGFEQRQHTTFVHVAVRRWSHHIARQFKIDIDALHAGLGKPVYALEEPTNPSLPKFLKLHGFHFHSRTIDVQGRDVAVFERPIKWAAEVHNPPTQSRKATPGAPSRTTSSRA